MSTHGQFNTKSPTIKRILKEAAELASTPDPTLHASPLDSNLFEWHFTLAGPPSTPYTHGIYHGRIILPPTYPLRPPSFRFLTPSGRFETNREICLSISGHHEESWQPAWGVRTALVAIRSFMKEEAGGQVGGLEMREGGRRGLARESRVWRCGACGGRTNEEVMAEWAGGEGERASGMAVAVAEEAVPDGLRLGYRDELGKSGEEPRGTGRLVDAVEESASAAAARPHSSTAQPLRPTTSTFPLPAPITSTIPTASSSILFSPPPSHQPSAPLPTRRTHPHGVTASATVGVGVPTWIDKAIGGVLLGLAVMVLRKLWLYL